MSQGYDRKLLEADGLQVHYGRRTAIAGASLRIEPGFVTSVVGPNGAGKSSLLNTVAGLVEPSGGNVRLDGVDITGKPAEYLVRRGIALVPEGKRVFSSLTVEENMRLAAAAFGAPGAGRVEECLDLFPRLVSRRRQRASLLSGGEQQQLMIARALAGSPRFLLLDEPSLGLGPQVVQDIFTIIRRLAEKGVGVLLVEQYVQRAVAISARVYVLARGHLVLDMSGEEARLSITRGEFFKAYSGRG